MEEEPPPQPSRQRGPVHLWVVGVLLVLWNAWGLAIAIAAQSGLFFADAPPEAAAYFAAQPLWFIVFADIGPLAGVAGAVALLLQHKAAPQLFTLQLAVLVLANAYDVLAGTSPMLDDFGAIAGSLVLLPVLGAQIAYAHYLRNRGVLY